MQSIVSITPGVTTGTTPYTGHHRMNEMDKGIGMIPVGNRDRVKPNEIHLVGNAEEATEVDRWNRHVSSH